MFNIDFYVDPLTGMANLFSLINEDVANICGENGSILAFDLARFKVINELYGREIGDLHLKNFVTVINTFIDDKKWGLDKAATYRIGGDEFIIILPEKTNSEAAILCEKIKQAFNVITEDLGIVNAGLRTAILPYSKKTISTSILLKWVNEALAETGSEREELANLPAWADRLIETMVMRIRETISMFNKAHQLAHSDEVSGLPNHRAAQLLLNRMLDAYMRYNKPFSLLFIDGDNLKQYNNLGYRRGNQMIKDLASLIESVLRHDDRVFRWLSGDEFLVLLSNTGREEALIIGERIRSTIEVKTKEWPFPITVSIGVSSCPYDGITVEQLLSRVEQANTEAKRSGKNQVICLPNETKN